MQSTFCFPRLEKRNSEKFEFGQNLHLVDISRNGFFLVVI